MLLFVHVTVVGLSIVAVTPVWNVLPDVLHAQLMILLKHAHSVTRTMVMKQIQVMLLFVHAWLMVGLSIVVLPPVWLVLLDVPHAQLMILLKHAHNVILQIIL